MVDSGFVVRTESAFVDHHKPGLVSLAAIMKGFETAGLLLAVQLLQGLSTWPVDVLYGLAQLNATGISTNPVDGFHSKLKRVHNTAL